MVITSLPSSKSRLVLQSASYFALSLTTAAAAELLRADEDENEDLWSTYRFLQTNTSEPTKNPTLSPSKAPTVSPTPNPTESPTNLPTFSPTKEEENNVTPALLGITALVIFCCAVAFLTFQYMAGPVKKPSNDNKDNVDGNGKPITEPHGVELDLTRPFQDNNNSNNRDSLSTIFTAGRRSTMSGIHSEKYEADDGMDQHLLGMMRDKRHLHNEKYKEPKKSLQNTAPRRQVAKGAGTESIKEMERDVDIDESSQFSANAPDSEV